MKKYLKFSAMALLGVLLVFSVSSCCDDDPDQNDVKPPDVDEVFTISGLVAGMNGKGIQGAEVTMNGSATAKVVTNSNGYFVLEDVKAGAYNLKVIATDKISKETYVEILDNGTGQNVVWNVMLASEKSVANVEVTTESGGTETVETEALEGNDNAKVDVEVTIPPNGTNKNATIEVIPIYAEADAVTLRSTAAEERSLRAAVSALLVGIKLSCDDNSVTIENPFDLSFDLGDDVPVNNVKARKLSGEQWSNAASRVEDGKIIVSVDEFTSYGLFVDVNFSSSTQNEALSFSQNYWNNLYGNDIMKVGTAAFTYKVGADLNIKMATTVFTALLIQVLAQQIGVGSYEAQGNYPINVTLPIGTALRIKGVQKINTVKAAVGNKSATGTQFGNVSITVTTSNRSHTGGSN